MPDGALPETLPIEAARERFFTAATGTPPTDGQREFIQSLAEDIAQLGAHIEASIPAGRNKSLALTALEDVQMRANRAIFATGASK